MYHAIVKRIAHRNFERVNAKDYDALLKDCVPEVRHRFGGRHALGGERHTRDGLRLWFGRLGRVMPTLRLHVTDVWATGWPWRTTVVIRWTATGEPLDGGPYANHGVHIVEMRWGKVVSIDANEDSQAVADVLRRQAAGGIVEAAAAPIET